MEYMCGHLFVLTNGTVDGECSEKLFKNIIGSIRNSISYSIFELHTSPFSPYLEWKKVMYNSERDGLNPDNLILYHPEMVDFVSTTW